MQYPSSPRASLSMHIERGFDALGATKHIHATTKRGSTWPGGTTTEQNRRSWSAAAICCNNTHTKPQFRPYSLSRRARESLP